MLISRSEKMQFLPRHDDALICLGLKQLETSFIRIKDKLGHSCSLRGKAVTAPVAPVDAWSKSLPYGFFISMRGG